MLWDTRAAYSLPVEHVRPGTITLHWVYICWMVMGRWLQPRWVHATCTTLHLLTYGADQWKHRSSPSQAFVRGIHRSPMNSVHKGPVTQKMFPFDDIIMFSSYLARVGRVRFNYLARVGHVVTDLPDSSLPWPSPPLGLIMSFYPYHIDYQHP